MSVMPDLNRTTPLLDFEAACVRLNQWRGQMVENFARNEQAVTEALVVLNAAGLELKGTKYPHLVGQRYDRLVSLLGSVSENDGSARVALTALERFRRHDGLRAMLCHGVTKAAVDRAGQWVAIMNLLKFKAGAAHSEKLAIDESEGVSLLAQLVDDRRKLCSALGQVRRQFSAHQTP